MSIFASQTQETFPIPWDPPHTVTVRKLTGKEVEAAQEAHHGSIATGRARSWATTFRRMLEKGASDPEVLKAIADPLTGYDRFAVIQAGLRAWTYPPRLMPPADLKDLGVRATIAAEREQAIDDLDDEAADYIATVILKLTKPGLFHATEEDATAAQKETDAVPPIADR